MKKMMIVFLLIIILIPCFPTVIALEWQPEAKQSDIVEQSKKILTALKIINNDDKFLKNDTITRSEFAEITARFIKINELDITSFKAKFTDVPEEHEAAAQISALAALDIISGTTNNQFHPDEPIMAKDALYILLYALGYKEYVSRKGGYPYGGYITASDIGLDIPGETEKELSVDNAVLLFCRALDVKIMTVLPYGEGSSRYMAGETVLACYFNTTKIKGRIDGNSRFSLSGSSCAENEIIISSQIYTLGMDCPWEYVGQYADCYLLKDVDGTEKVILILPNTQNQILTVESENISGYENSRYEYMDEKGKQCSIQINKDMDIVYNYSLMMTYDSDLFVPDDGYITLIDNNHDGKYEVLYIISYKDYVVGNISKEGDMLYVYDKNGYYKTPVLIVSGKGKDLTSLLDTAGDEIKSAAIRKNDIISVIGNEQGGCLKAAKIIRSRESVNGSLKEIIKDDENGVALVINDKTYNISKSFEETANTLSPRDNITIFLDYKGKISSAADINRMNLPMSIGYLIQAKLTEGIDSTVEFKVFTEFDKIVYYRGARKIKVNGKSMDYLEAVQFMQNGNSSILPQVFCFTINDSGDIDSIRISQPYNSENSSDIGLYTLYDKNTELYYFYPTYSFYGAVNIRNDTMIFSVPYDSQNGDDDDYRLLQESDLELIQYKLKAYALSKNSITADVLVVSTSNDAINSSAPVSVVKAVSSDLDEDGNVTSKISVVNYNGESQVYLKNEQILKSASYYGDSSGKMYTVEVGDVIRYNLDNRNKITGIQILYSSDKKQFLQNASIDTSGYRTEQRFTAVHAYRTDGTYIQFVPKDYFLTHSDVDIANTSTYRKGAFKVIINQQTNQENRVYTGSADDIKTYSDCGTQCSDMIMVTDDGYERLLIIIK